MAKSIDYSDRFIYENLTPIFSIGSCYLFSKIFSKPYCITFLSTLNKKIKIRRLLLKILFEYFTEYTQLYPEPAKLK